MIHLCCFHTQLCIACDLPSQVACDTTSCLFSYPAADFASASRPKKMNILTIEIKSELI